MGISQPANLNMPKNFQTDNHSLSLKIENPSPSQRIYIIYNTSQRRILSSCSSFSFQNRLFLLSNRSCHRCHSGTVVQVRQNKRVTILSYNPILSYECSKSDRDTHFSFLSCPQIPKKGDICQVYTIVEHRNSIKFDSE